MIKFTNLSKAYKKNILALDNINCEINQGEFVYLVGKSGAGKTSLIKILTCEEEITKGTALVGNINLTNLSQRNIPFLRRQLGIVPQTILLLNHLTVFENVAYALMAIEVDKSKIREKTLLALELVGMLPYEKCYPGELSQGQKQKVIIARAVANQPKIIIADEPTAHLDAKSAIEIMRIFYRLNQLGSLILMATHNSTIVNTLRYRVLEIDNGRLIRDQNGGSYGLANDEKDVYII